MKLISKIESVRTADKYLQSKKPAIALKFENNQQILQYIEKEEKRLEKESYERGTIFKDKKACDNDGFYVLSTFTIDGLPYGVLIGIEDGNRYLDPVLISDLIRVTKKEFRLIADKNFEVVHIKVSEREL